MSSSLQSIREAIGSTNTTRVEPGLSLSDAFALLRNDRRYWVVSHLAKTAESATLSELAERRAAEECDCPLEQVTSDERKRVYIALYQAHLPRLVDADVLAEGAEGYTIADTTSARAVCDLVDVAERSWRVDQ